MMVPFCVYVPATGEILRTGGAPAAFTALQADVGEAVMEVEARDDLHYILNGTVVDRPAMPIAHPWSGPLDTPILFVGVPAGAEVTHPGGTAVMDGSGVLSWASDVPGTFVFLFRKFPFKPLEVSIDIG